MGLDVSVWQTNTPDLTGMSFLIARATYGTSTDPKYDQHVTAARKAGILTGAYHFGRNGPVQPQVDAFLGAAGDVDLLALDLENDQGSPRMTAAQATAFIKAVQVKGKKIALYASESAFTDLGQDWNWIANYSQRPAKRFDIWQFGPIKGIDGNRFEGTLAELQALSNLITGGDMPPAPITDEREVVIDIAPNSPLLDLDGKTKLGTSPTTVLAGRRSPYGTVFGRYTTATVNGVRRPVIVRVPDTAVHPLPITATADCSAIQTQLDAANARVTAAITALGGHP